VTGFLAEALPLVTLGLSLVGTGALCVWLGNRKSRP
jgi:hypothetical protein